MLTYIRSFLALALIFLSSSPAFCMDQKGIQEVKKYTVGLKILNDTYAGQNINPIHMTVTYLGAADEYKLERAKKLLAAINLLRPIIINIGAVDTFGTQDRPVPVRRLIIQRSEIEELLISFHRELGECEPFQPKKLDIPNWHVAMRDTKFQEELSSKAQNQGYLLGGKLFIKPLGNFDPIAEFQ